MGCIVEGPVVGDAARRVRVKPLSRPQIQHMPARPPDPGTPTVQRVYTHHMEAPEIDPQVRWGDGRSPLLHGALTANGGARFPTQPLSPAVTSETVT